MRTTATIVSRAVAASVAVAALLVGCTPTDNGEGGDGETSEQLDDPAGATDVGDVSGSQDTLPLGTTAEELPSDVDLSMLGDSVIVAAVQWVLQALASDEPPSFEAIEGVVTTEVLAEAPARQLQAVLTQIAGTYRITTVEQAEADRFIGEIADGTGQRWRLVVAVDDGDPPRIEGLFFGEPMANPARFEDWEEVVDALSEVADQVSWLAAETSDGACQPIAAERPETRQAVASVGKLYVLGAVAEAVAAGEVAWDDEVVVTDELRSLPTGRLQDEPAGTTVTVAEAADLMIAISDNTATDLLIDLVGRDAVEAATAEYGHQDPTATQPFLTTREVFQLFWQVNQGQREGYLDGDLQARREVLEELADLPLDIAVEDLTAGPVAADQIGWYASPAELCTALVTLRERAATPELAPVDEALGHNPIVRLGDAWTSSSAKGGSMPGVLAFAWELERDDGRRFSFSVLLQDESAVDQGAAIPLVEGALELLAGTDR